MPVLTHADLRLNYQLMGPAPVRGTAPLALIHGLGANLAFWYLGAMQHLGRDRTILLHDLRGHGRSSMPERGYGLHHMAEDFRLLLDGLGIERAHVVGHSHGARVALVFALAHPERVESLTIADTQLRALQPPMRLGEWPHWPAWKADLAARGVTSFPPEDAEIDFRLLAELGPRSAGGSGARAQADLSDPDGALPELAVAEMARADPARADFPLGLPAADRPRLRAAARLGGEGPPRIDLRSRQMGQRGARQWQTLMETTCAAEEMHDESRINPAALPELTMPSLLMYGQMSHCVPTSERLLGLMPNARRLLVPGAGHFFPIVKPRVTARAIDAFLRGVDGGAPRLGRARRAAQGRAARAALLGRRPG